MKLETENAPARDLLLQSIHCITMLIVQELNAYNNEAVNPKASPDASDYFIQVTHGKIGNLRRIRQELEDIVTHDTHEAP